MFIARNIISTLTKATAMTQSNERSVNVIDPLTPSTQGNTMIDWPSIEYIMPADLTFSADRAEEYHHKMVRKLHVEI